MRLLVTGALGHIGSRTLLELPKIFHGLELVMVDNLSSQRFSSLFHLPREARYRFVEGDILDIDLSPLVGSADAVVHLAAITDAPRSFENPGLVERVNVDGTKRVAMHCLREDVPLVFVSTTSVYGPLGATVAEDCPPGALCPQSPYATSKLAAERALAGLGNEGLRFITFRFGTIYGPSPGMRFHTAVNKFCWQAVNGIPLTVWRTALHQKRPYLDLDDAVRAIAFAVDQKLFDGQTLNAVTENSTVQQVIDAIRIHVPDLAVALVDHEIMNQQSYEVLSERLRLRGFDFRGNLARGIARTMEQLEGLLHR